MKKKAISIAEACVVLFSILLLGGCGSRIDYSLPANPIEFDTGTFLRKRSRNLRLTGNGFMEGLILEHTR